VLLILAVMIDACFVDFLICGWIRKQIR